MSATAAAMPMAAAIAVAIMATVRRPLQHTHMLQNNTKKDRASGLTCGWNRGFLSLPRIGSPLYKKEDKEVIITATCREKKTAVVVHDLHLRIYVNNNNNNNKILPSFYGFFFPCFS